MEPIPDNYFVNRLPRLRAHTRWSSALLRQPSLRLALEANHPGRAVEATRVTLLKLEVSRCDREAWVELDPLGLGSEEIQGRDAGTEDRGLLLMVIDNGGEHDGQFAL